jgi:hypothetical protein
LLRFNKGLARGAFSALLRATIACRSAPFRELNSIVRQHNSNNNRAEIITLKVNCA